MSERITPSMVTSTTLDNLNASLAAMERTSDELSSGKTILEPSDNPYGASQVIDLQSQLEGLSTYEANAQDGISWEQTASSSMDNMSEVTQRVRELLVQGANGTYNKSDLETMALDVEQLTETIKQDANAQYAGQYIFSGTATTTAPYESGANDEYAGNEEGVSRSVGPGASIAKTMRTGTAEAQSELGGVYLEKLDGNMETLRDLQASAGSATDQMQTALTRNEDLQSSITGALANVDSTNVAEASIDYANEQAAYEAALRAGASIVQESLLNFLQ